MRKPILAPDYIQNIQPYQPGKPISDLVREFGLNGKGIIKLTSNENPLGTSPKVQKIIHDNLLNIFRYPDGACVDLTKSCAQHWNVSEQRLIFGNGSNDILEMVAKTFLSPTDEAIYSEYAFAVYPLATLAMGAKGIEIPSIHFGCNLNGMLDAVTYKTKIIFIANPNNPTGTWVNNEQIYQFLKKVPSHVLVVLDEAYDEYLPNTEFSKSLPYLNEFDNLFICRTFSKIYGLAGLRLGIGFSSERVINFLHRIRQPFNVNYLAQLAGVSALQDQDFVKRSRENNFSGKEQIENGLMQMNLFFIPSHANFISFKVKNAQGVYQRLLEHGIIIRPLAGYNMNDFLRVTIGLPMENARFLEVLSKVT